MPLVLVVDDDPVAVRSLVAVVEEDPALDGIGATSIAEARERMAGCAAAIVGMRVHAAGIEDGVALLADLHAKDPLIEGLITTPAVDHEATSRALAAVGPVRHVARPATAAQVLPRVHAALERRALRVQLREVEAQLAHRDRALSATSGSLETATERLVEAEQLAAVGRVLTGVAHELMQQLALVGYA